MNRQLPYWGRVTVVDHINRQNAFLGSFLLLVGGVAYLLNSWSLFPPPYLWIRITIPLLLLIGFVGGVLRRKPLLILGQIGGWFFLLVVIRVALPDWDDYWHAGKQIPTGGSELLRVIVLFAIAVLLLVCLYSRRLQQPAPSH
jgi:hypothetical protein